MSEHELNNHSTPGIKQINLVQITEQELAGDNTNTLPPAVPAEILNYQPQPYLIGPGDSLYITVWDHPELTSPAGSQQQTAANGRLVRSDGTLFYPYVGTFKVAGMDIEQLRQTIATKLAHYIQHPQVDVSVVGYSSQRITLSGAFTKTDPQQITAVPLTLDQVLGSASIDTAHADLSDLVLTRDGHDFRIDLNRLTGTSAAHDIYLKPGDRLFLNYNDNKEIYVMGEVVRPMAISFKTTDLSLTQALGRAGGLNPITASGKSVYVIRGAKDLAHEKATVFHLNARSPAAFALADNFHVRAGDVVFVGPAAITQWGRVLSQLVPLSSLVGNAAFAREQINATP